MDEPGDETIPWKTNASARCQGLEDTLYRTDAFIANTANYRLICLKIDIRVPQPATP